MAAAERPPVGGGLTSASSRALLPLVGEPRFEPRAIRFTLDDEIVGVAGEAIDRALSPDGSAKVASHSSGPRFEVTITDRAIALEQQVVEVTTLDGVEDVDGKVVEDEKVDGDELRSSAS